MKRHWVFSTTDDTEKVLPTSAFDILPFKWESLANWAPGCDLHQFLKVLLEPSGYEATADSFFDRACGDFSAIVLSFQDHADAASPARAAEHHRIDIPDFSDCERLGVVGKYMAAWDNVVGNMLSESSFFSLPHLLESCSDLQSSIDLAARLYYRQALQVLRGFLESAVLPIHFSRQPQAYKDWQQDNFRVPSMRGSGGLLATLEKEGLISRELSAAVGDLYGALNAYIHGAQSALNNSGVPTGEWRGHVFRLRDYDLWSESFRTAVEIGLKLLKLHHVQWSQRVERGERICRVCHGTNFSSRRVRKPQPLVEWKCLGCRNVFSEDKSGARVVVTTFESNEGEPSLALGRPRRG